MKGRPLEFLLLLFAGWVNRRQLAMIDYLKNGESDPARASAEPAAAIHR
jgi:hypothetical protein